MFLVTELEVKGTRVYEIDSGTNHMNADGNRGNNRYTQSHDRPEYRRPRSGADSYAQGRGKQTPSYDYRGSERRRNDEYGDDRSYDSRRRDYGYKGDNGSRRDDHYYNRKYDYESVILLNFLRILECETMEH